MRRNQGYYRRVVATAEKPLTIKTLAFRETRYPLEMDSRFECSEQLWSAIVPNAVRSLQMCAHETYLDCPYYEQLMYSGDGRLEALATYVIARDEKLPRKAIRMFNDSRMVCGATQSRYPTRTTQLIPSFSLWWIGMVHDYAMWRGDRDLIHGLLPAIRMLIDWLLSYRNGAGLIRNGDGEKQSYFGWNFYDWVPDWIDGVPPDGARGASGLLNWHFALAVRLASELETMAGEDICARRMEAIGRAHAECVRKAFWDDGRRLFADDLAKRNFSEHTQCLAILSGQLDEDTRNMVGNALRHAKGLSRTTISFTHYLFETYRLLGYMDLFFRRMQLWQDAVSSGFKTLPEWPNPTRSDCHGWGAHVLYHYFATILGIRPASLGFNTVRIAPQLGPLTSAQGTLVHPQGDIEVRFELDDRILHGAIRLPRNVNGAFVYKNQRRRLTGGKLCEF